MEATQGGSGEPTSTLGDGQELSGVGLELGFSRAPGLALVHLSNRTKMSAPARKGPLVAGSCLE